eukprot:gene14828-10603_t
MTKVWIPVDVYENRALRDFIAIWSFREKAHHERAAKLQDFENRSVSVEDVYERVCAMFREKTPEIVGYIGRLTDIETSIEADIVRGNLTPENLRQYFLAVFTIVEDAAVAPSNTDLDFFDMLRQLTESGTISNDMAMALDEARRISNSVEYNSYYRPECSLEMTRRLLEQTFRFVSTLWIAPESEPESESEPEPEPEPVGAAEATTQEQSRFGSQHFVSATNTGSVAAAAMPLDTAIDNAPVLSVSIAAAVAPASAVAPRRTLTLRDATDEDAPSPTCDTAGKRLVFQRWCALLCEHIRQFEIRGGAVLPPEEEGTREFLCISPQLLNDSAIIFTTYQYTAAPAYIVFYIQRQRLPPFGTGDNGRMPLFRLMGFSSATDVVHHRTFHQLFGRVGIHVDVHNQRFETRSATDATTVVTFTCEIKRHQSYCSVAASVTTVVPEVKEQPRQLLRYDPTLTKLGLHSTGIGASTGAPAMSLEPADAIAPLVRLFGDRDVTVRQKAARVVWNILVSKENRVLVAKAGAIAPLIRLLGDCDVTVRRTAAGALANMAFNAESKVLIAEAGAIPPLVRLLGDGDVVVRRCTANALSIIAVNEKNKVLMAQAGAIPPLVRLLSDSDIEVRQQAAGALSNIACYANNQVLVAEAGGIPQLVHLLGDGNLTVRQQAADALMHITANETNKVLVAEAGAIPPLVRLLGDSGVKAREKAAGALANIAGNAENQVLVAEAGAIAPLVQLLHAEEDAETRRFAQPLLDVIAVCSEGIYFRKV